MDDRHTTACDTFVFLPRLTFYACLRDAHAFVRRTENVPFPNNDRRAFGFRYRRNEDLFANVNRFVRVRAESDERTIEPLRRVLIFRPRLNNEVVDRFATRRKRINVDYVTLTLFETCFSDLALS